jgi:uncharacterized hydrophobic protein (TIGR00271 family)
MQLFPLRLLDLHQDQDDFEEIDNSIRSGARIGGINLWVLMFAIAIASVGLNVNSTAVIIGAMLISPLMGPIIGIGYGAGVNDFALVKSAAKNLGFFVLISLITSSVYFLITPLSEAHSELLARTYPTIWDVLIAFFGGSAGILALTRKSRSTVISGVAIATALMPPLCTTGYGIATAQPVFFLGAFYLFIINGVFIAFATLIFVKLLNLPQHSFLNEFDQKKSKIWIASILLITLLPSGWLAYKMVQDEVFTTSARKFVQEIEKNDQLIVLEKRIDPKLREISLVISGKNLPNTYIEQQKSKLENFGLAHANLLIRRLENENVQGEISQLKQEIQQNISAALIKSIEQKNSYIHELEQKIFTYESIRQDQAKLLRELNAQYHGITDLQLVMSNSQVSGTQSVIVQIWVSRAFQPAEKNRIASWLAARYSDKRTYIYFESTGVVHAR